MPPQPGPRDRKQAPIPVAIGLVVLATIALLMPAQNDTWWHLRSGREMIATRTLLFRDVFSSTAYGGFFWNHSWLSQVVFYLLYAAGGLPLLTAVCAAAVVSAWIVVWQLMKGDALDRLVLLAPAVAAGTVTWSLRPQVFSVLLVPVTVFLVERGRWRWLPPLFLAWANLHAGFVLGLVLAGIALIDTAIEQRDRLVACSGWFVVSMLATLATPLGVRNWLEVIASMRRSQANAIQEWLPTAPPPQHLVFWGLAALLVLLTAIRWRRLATPGDRTIVMMSLVTLVLAVRSFRNVTPFTILAAVALSRLIWQGQKDAAPGQPVGISLPALTVAGLVGAAVVGTAWARSWPLLQWTPMSRAAADAIASCPEPLYNTYEGGGPIAWFVPTQRVFVDSRQDPYPTWLVQQASDVERTGDFGPLFARFGINCAAVPPTSGVSVALAQHGWISTYSDAQWRVFVRPGLSSASYPDLAGSAARETVTPAGSSCSNRRNASCRRRHSASVRAKNSTDRSDAAT
jgi:hypothetical protein